MNFEFKFTHYYTHLVNLNQLIEKPVENQWHPAARRWVVQSLLISTVKTQRAPYPPGRGIVLNPK